MENTKRHAVETCLDSPGSSSDVAGALAVLAKAAVRTQDIDLRHDRATLEALDCLEDLAGCRIAAVGIFRAALAIPHPVTRRRTVGDAYNALVTFVEAGMAED